MKRKRRSVSPFSLSFLDIMFCGFGAVVLLVLLLNGDTVRVRREASGALQAQAAALEASLLAAESRLASAEKRLDQTGAEIERSEARSRELAEALQSRRDEASRTDSDTRSRVVRVESLKQQLRQLEQDNSRLAEQRAAAKAKGSRVRRFVGDGDRQYLTGLKLGGKRVLILLDRSASMLDETLVNIIIKRNLPDQSRRQADKWQRALSTVEWLLANLPGAGSYQVMTFDTRAEVLVKGSSGTWHLVSDSGGMDAAVRALRQIAPAGGTSLYHAFQAAGELSPRPDNIVLITDGLPTQGRQKPGGNTVTARQRLDLFDQATEALPKGVSVNTILLPMEGDAYAAAAFWELALRTQGSFLTPSRDWP